jgi:DDE family transposase
MIPCPSLLVSLVSLVDRLPDPPQPSAKRGRGRPPVYTNKLFLKALVIMIVRHLHKVGELLSVLEQPTDEMQQLRAILSENGRYPSRRTWERRLCALPETLPAQIGCLGRHLVDLLDPWQFCGRAVAIDSTVLRACGGVWHKKHPEAGVVPHTRIDTEAHWTKSGWHHPQAGTRVYGWKLHLCCSAGDVWIPLAADLTPANVADNEKAPDLLDELPLQPVYVLGDQHYNTPEIEEHCDHRGRILVTTQHGAYPHTGPGIEVRRVFHKLRSITIENFNEQFKGIFSAHDQVQTKGEVATKRWAFGSVLVYQIALMHRYEHKLPLRQELKPFLRAA